MSEGRVSGRGGEDLAVFSIFPHGALLERGRVFSVVTWDDLIYLLIEIGLRQVNDKLILFTFMSYHYGLIIVYVFIYPDVLHLIFLRAHS